MVKYEHIIQEIVKVISQFTFEFTFIEMQCKMELREVPKDVLDKLGEKKIMENVVNKVFYMRLPDGKVIDVNSFCDFIKKNDIKSGSKILFNFKYVRWELTEDLCTTQIKKYIKQQLTNNNDLVLSVLKKVLIVEELKNKQIDGYLGEVVVKKSNFIEQGKFYIQANCPPEQAYKLINETIDELQVEKENKSQIFSEDNTLQQRERKKIKIFISYSHEDEKIKKKLETHLKGLERTVGVITWHDGKIIAGKEWDEKIKKELREAGIILLLISANFNASDYIWKEELIVAIERHNKGEVIVIPIFASECDTVDMPYMKLQGLPKNAKPISKFSRKDTAYTEISKGIRYAIEEKLKS